MNEDEIEAVLAHEFSHVYNRNMQSLLPLAIIFSIPYVFFLMLSFVLVLGYYLIPMSNNVKAVISLFVLFFFSIGIFIGLYSTRIRNWISTKMEIRSDIEAVLKTGKSEALKNALLKMYYSHYNYEKRPGHLSQIKLGLSYLKDYYTGYTHPHPKERLENLAFANQVININKEKINPIEIKVKK